MFNSHNSRWKLSIPFFFFLLPSITFSKMISGTILDENNNLISNGYTFKKINIHSDGTPWRPVIHIRDVCNAILAILIAPKEIINKQSFNVGIINGNYTVKKMAETVKSLISGSEIIYSNNHKTDERTYKVSFNIILKVLKE